jgi:nitrate reductase assembly molybdenum cofactor insertion protein NarJ
MTDVIGASLAGGYRGRMPVQGDVQRLARALQRPHAGYAERIDRTRKAVAGRSVEAARQLEVFIGRISDLTIDELREVYDETFHPGGPNALGPAVDSLAHGAAGQPEVRAALDVLTPLLDRLDADRNPFAYVVRALCCVLLTVAAESRVSG